MRPKSPKKTFEEKFSTTVEFSDRVMSLLCTQPEQRSVMLDVIKRVLESKILLRSGDRENSELMFNAARVHIYDSSNATAHEKWDAIIKICDKFHEFAESAVETEDDFMFLEKTLRRPKESLAGILAEHFKSLFSEPMKTAIELRNAHKITKCCGIAAIFMWIIMFIAPIVYNIMLLDSYKWPSLLELFSAFPIVSLIAAIIGSFWQFGFWLGLLVLLLSIFGCVGFCVLQEKADKRSISYLQAKLKSYLNTATKVTPDTPTPTQSSSEEKGQNHE